MKIIFSLLLGLSAACLTTQAQTIMLLPELPSDSLLKRTVPPLGLSGGVLSIGTAFYRNLQDPLNVVRATLDNMAVRKPGPDQQYKIQNSVPPQPSIEKLIPDLKKKNADF